jgi:hypothetical protein
MDVAKLRSGESPKRWHEHAIKVDQTEPGISHDYISVLKVTVSYFCFFQLLDQFRPTRRKRGKSLCVLFRIDNFSDVYIERVSSNPIHDQKRVTEHVTKITFFVSAARTSQVKPYEETIGRACRQADIDFSVATLEAQNMSDWQTAMAEARSAKMLLLKDRAAGEQRFKEVLERYGEDGMIYFIRGEGYESLEEKKSALNDYRLAEILFPLPKYKDQARTAAARIEARLPAAKKVLRSEIDVETILKAVPDPLIAKAVQDAERFIETDPAEAVRAVGERGVRGLIRYLEYQHRLESAESWRQRTKQLTERKIISEIAAYEMDAVREIRNKVASEGASVSRLDAEASVNMFVEALSNIFRSGQDK